MSFRSNQNCFSPNLLYKYLVGWLLFMSALCVDVSVSQVALDVPFQTQVKSKTFSFEAISVLTPFDKASDWDDFDDDDDDKKESKKHTYYLDKQLVTIFIVKKVYDGSFHFLEYCKIPFYIFCNQFKTHLAPFQF